jgi:sugar O-acyltransferase (sialic acid O-acetyltransferase NeuD family)
MILIGYSGHGFVACSILKTAGSIVIAYCDNEEKKYNPFQLQYLGNEDSELAKQAFEKNAIFIGIGNNVIRQKVFEKLHNDCFQIANAIHPSSIICTSANIANKGVMLGARSTIQPLAKIGNGVICNTGCIIEHECVVEAFSHIGPGAILCGNVHVGEGSFIGAGAVVRQGITIGKNCIVGAGAVVVNDIPDFSKVVGIPAR